MSGAWYCPYIQNGERGPSSSRGIRSRIHAMRRTRVSLPFSAAPATTWPLAAARAPTTKSRWWACSSGATAKEDAFSRRFPCDKGLAEAGPCRRARRGIRLSRSSGALRSACRHWRVSWFTRRVAVICHGFGPTLGGAQRPKAATAHVCPSSSTWAGGTRLKVGLVASLKPTRAANITGVSVLFNVVVAKQFEFATRKQCQPYN